MSATIGLIALAGYLYGIEELTTFGPFVMVALNTAMEPASLSGAALATRTDEGLLGP